MNIIPVIVVQGCISVYNLTLIFLRKEKRRKSCFINYQGIFLERVSKQKSF